MGKSRLTKPQIRQKAKEIVDELLKEHGQAVCAGILQELGDRVQKPTGRRAEADWEILLEMARRLASGVAKDVTDAARGLADRIQGVSEKTAVNRLRNSYPKFRAALEAELRAETENEEDATRRAKKDAVIARAFEEDVEIWDL